MRGVEWRPLPSGGVRVAAVMLLLLLGCSFAARIYTLARPLDLEIVAMTAVGLSTWTLAALVGILGFGCRSLRYVIGDRELTIAWLWVRESIPLGCIHGIHGGERFGRRAKVKGINWPGCYVGTAEAGGLGPVSYFGTSSWPSDSLIISTPRRSFAITPTDAEAFKRYLIPRLEQLTEEDAAGAPEPTTSTISSWLQFSPRDLQRAAAWTSMAFLVPMAVWLVLQIPVDVPDTRTSAGFADTAEVNDWTSVGQTFVTSREGLSRIDVPLSTLKRSDEAALQFYVRDDPKGANLRFEQLSLAELVEGRVSDLSKIRWENPPWVSFRFEPLNGYAGKQLYFSVEGKNIPKANTVQAPFAYPNGYKQGEAYREEKPAGANMVFQSYTTGKLLDIFEVTFPQLPKERPGVLGREVAYRGLALAGLALTILLFVSISRLALCHPSFGEW